RPSSRGPVEPIKDCRTGAVLILIQGQRGKHDATTARMDSFLLVPVRLGRSVERLLPVRGCEPSTANLAPTSDRATPRRDRERNGKRPVPIHPSHATVIVR